MRLITLLILDKEKVYYFLSLFQATFLL